MLARCAYCQKTFETDRFGVQHCPHCGQQVHLADPAGAAPTEPAAPAPPPPPAGAAPPPGSPPAGWPPPGYPPPGYAPPGAPGAAWAVGEADAPFARRAQLGWFRSYVQTWKLACLQPAEFFRSVRVGAPGSAVLFGVVAMTIASWFQALYGAVMGAATRGMIEEALKQVPQGSQFQDTWMVSWMSGATAIGVVAQLVAAPFIAAAWILVWAAIYQVFLLVLGAASRGFEATLTVVGYASGALLVGAAPVPGLANLVGMVWFAFAAAIGFREAHRTSSGKAWGALTLPFVAGCLCCCAAAWMMFTGLSSLKVHGG
ncbi:MAG TPA: YIP1 family protein [Anaeromyxobacteraceae bacterium]|nr:YIP1 family protein [Anaeromyxobacteraceae bacterium]